jgi:NADPH-dependent curcumin reductase CurA
MAETNQQILFAARPEEWPAPETFEIVETPMPEQGEGEILVRNVALSLDPYMRGRMRERKSYTAGFELGKVLQGGVVGEVIATKNNQRFAVGDYVSGLLGWEQFSVASGKGMLKIDLDAAPLSAHLGVLGMPGFTAYVGLLDIGQPKAGETVYVSAAASTVGSAVGQIAKLKGCHVVGSAGSDEKVEACLKRFGYDACFNYKNADKLHRAIREVCPEGIDVYFENVGGAMFDAALLNINVGARIPLCGMISQYNLAAPEGLKNLGNLLVNRARLQGFIIFDHYHRWADFVTDMSGWLADGSVTYAEHITDGLENAPAAFVDMLRGAHLGKSVVRIGPDRA